MLLTKNMEQYVGHENDCSLSLSVETLEENDFWRDYEVCTKIIDAGIKSHFVLLDNSSLNNVKRITRTKLSDIEAVYGEDAYSLLNFALIGDPERPGEVEQECAIVLNIRKANNGDRKQLRSQLRFVPENCYICEGWSGTGCSYGLPFIQKEDGTIRWLHYSDVLSRTKSGKKPSQRDFSDFPQEMLAEHIIDSIPDLMDCNIARVTYKGVDALIPVSRSGAKKTFKNREKEQGVKKRLIHNVASHSRKNMQPGTKVDAHVRGTSRFTMNGIDICLFASWEQVVLILKNEHKKRQNEKHANTRKEK